MNAEQLARDLASLEAEYDGDFFVDVRRLDSGGSYALREREVLPTASTFKLFVLCELFRQAEAGVVDLDAPLVARPEHWRGGDGVLRAMTPGQTLSVHNTAVLMVIVSDNVATSALVELVGAENVTSTMRGWGLADTDIHGGLPGGPNAARMEQPVSTPRDLCSLVTRIYREEILTPASCREIIRILRAQRCNDMLPRYTPVGEDWGEAETWIANKTGYGRCRVEVGIVHTHEITFSLAAFFRPHGSPRAPFKCLADYPPVLAMARACRAVYESMCG